MTTPEFVAASVVDSDGAGWTLSPHTDTEVGDLLLLFVPAGTSSPSVQGMERYGTIRHGFTNDPVTTLFYKIADADDAEGTTVYSSGSTAYGPVLLTYRNVDESDPFVYGRGSIAGGNFSEAILPSIENPLDADGLALTFHTTWNNTAFSGLPGVVRRERSSVYSTFITEELLPSGFTTNRTATHTAGRQSNLALLLRGTGQAGTRRGVFYGMDDITLPRAFPSIGAPRGYNPNRTDRLVLFDGAPAYELAVTSAIGNRRHLRLYVTGLSDLGTLSEVIADAEVVTEFVVSERAQGLIARSDSGNSNSPSGYVAYLAFGAQEFRIRRLSSGSYLSLATVDVEGVPFSSLSKIPTDGDRVRMRLRADSTRIKAKVWFSDEAEPTTGGPDDDGFQLAGTDSNILDGGVGPFLDSDGVRAYHWTRLGVSDASEPAPLVPLEALGPTEIAQPYVTGDGTWAWNADPKAIYHEGTHKRTYMAWASWGGAIVVASYDHDTGALEQFEVKTGLAESNNHNTAVLGIRPDGRILVVYSTHNGSSMWRRISTNAEDVTAWGSEGTVATGTLTYVHLAYLSAETRWYVFFRDGGPADSNRGPSFVTSDDDGALWSAKQRLVDSPISGARPYLKMSTAGVDRMDFTLNDDHPGAGDTNVYHFWYDGTWRDSEGVSLGSPPFVVANLTVAHEAASGVPSQPVDIALDGTIPVIVYAVFLSSTDIRYRYARWDGVNSWDTNEITESGRKIVEVAGEDQALAGLALDHSDPDVAYLSRQVASSPDRWEIERWETGDGGGSWSSEPVTTDSPIAPRKNIYPMVPRGDGPFEVLWNRSLFRNWDDWQTGVAAYPNPDLAIRPLIEFGMVRNYSAKAITGVDDQDTFKVWPDTGGAESDASAPGTGPIYIASEPTLNDLPVVRFPGNSAQRMSFSGGSNMVFTPGRTALFLARRTGSDALYQLLSHTSSNHQFRLATGDIVQITGSVTLGAPQIGGVQQDEWHIIVGLFQPNSAQVRLDGVDGVATSHSAFSWALNQIGGRLTSNELLIGDIAEIIVSNLVVPWTGAMLELAELYLHQEWFIEPSGEVNLAGSVDLAVLFEATLNVEQPFINLDGALDAPVDLEAGELFDSTPKLRSPEAQPLVLPAELELVAPIETGVIVTDDFNRPDEFPLDTSSSGHPWQAVDNGGLRVLDERCVHVGDDLLRSNVIDCGIADNNVSAFVQLAPRCDVRIIFRANADGSDYLYYRVRRTPSVDEVALWRVEDGEHSQIRRNSPAGLDALIAAGWVYALVDFSGSNTTLRMRGQTYMTRSLNRPTQNRFGQNTRHGLGIRVAADGDDGSTLLDDFHILKFVGTTGLAGDLDIPLDMESVLHTRAPLSASKLLPVHLDGELDVVGPLSLVPQPLLMPVNLTAALNVIFPPTTVQLSGGLEAQVFLDAQFNELDRVTLRSWDADESQRFLIPVNLNAVLDVAVPAEAPPVATQPINDPPLPTLTLVSPGQCDMGGYTYCIAIVRDDNDLTTAATCANITVPQDHAVLIGLPARPDGTSFMIWRNGEFLVRTKASEFLDDCTLETDPIPPPLENTTKMRRVQLAMIQRYSLIMPNPKLRGGVPYE